MAKRDEFGVKAFFAKWLAAPRGERVPKTQKELAQKLGVTEQWLSIIKRDKEFIEEVRTYRKRYLDKDLPDIYRSITKEAKNGCYHHAKLAVQLAGDLVDKREVTGKDGKDLFSETIMTDEEIQKEIADIMSSE